MINTTASATDVRPTAGSVCKYLDDIRSQLLNQSQVSKLQKASKLASLLAKGDTTPVHKHPEVLAGAHFPFSLYCLTSLHPLGTLTGDIRGCRCPLLSVQQEIIR
jgi:hypothetical protein